MSQSSVIKLREFLEKENLELVLTKPQVRFTEDGAVIIEKPSVTVMEKPNPKEEELTNA